MKSNWQPKSLNEALDHLIEKLKGQDMPKNEKEFLAKTHHFLGMHIRHAWFLWWTKEGAEQYKGWPKDKPAIVQEFNDMGIYHADDMSGIILTTLHRKYFNLPFELGHQVVHYTEYWKSKGVDMKKVCEG